jgi:hypothetical protein
MNPRILIIGATTLACLAMLVGIAGQRRELATLRTELQPPPAPEAVPGDSPAAPTATEGPAGNAPGPGPVLSPSPELLRLRSQAGQLADRKRELAGARTENEQLRVQLAARGTNAPAGQPLPPGYIRRSEAQWVGANTPENTIQSFLWALQNHDLTNLVKLMMPESGQKMMRQAGDSPDKFFEGAGMLPGMRIFNQQQMPDGSIQAEFEIMPGEPLPEKIRFQLMEGQWKLEIP